MAVSITNPPSIIYPDIILITDSHPHINGGGISQTLFNLFKGYPSKIILVDSRQEFKDSSSDILNVFYEQYTCVAVPYLKNRLGLFINGAIRRINLSFLQLISISFKKSYTVKERAVIIVSTTDTYKLLLGYKLAQSTSLPLITYFMDDWMATDYTKWIGGNTQRLGKSILENSCKWLFISEALKSVLIQRYGLVEKPALIVHNPVDVLERRPPSRKIEQSNSDSFRIVYAGSIWPMHIDAIELLALNLESISTKVGKTVLLDIYAPEAHWLENRNRLERVQVSYKGFRKYSDLVSILTEADVLLVAASFTKEYQYYSYSSVQTKLTDYMRIGKPILSIAPSKSAINEFVNLWQCGIIVDNAEVDSFISSMCNGIKHLMDKGDHLGYNGWQAAKEFFSKELVQRKLFEFIQISQA